MSIFLYTPQLLNRLAKVSAYRKEWRTHLTKHKEALKRVKYNSKAVRDFEKIHKFILTIISRKKWNIEFKVRQYLREIYHTCSIL